MLFIKDLAYEMEKSFVVAYIVFFIISILAVAWETDSDHWLALATNGAVGVTAVYAYEYRVDITILSLLALSTSLVWHSSGHLKTMDLFISRALAYYAFGCTAFPIKVVAPVVVFLTYVLTFEHIEDELYLTIPLLTLIALYKWYENTFTRNFFFAIIFGSAGVSIYRIAVWHHMWHVLAAVAIAFTLETPHMKSPQKKMKELDSVVSLRF